MPPITASIPKMALGLLIVRKKVCGMMPECLPEPGVPWSDRARRTREQQVPPEGDQQELSQPLDRSGMSDHHVVDRRHAEGRDRRVEPVAEDGAQPRGNAAPRTPWSPPA